MTESPAPLSDPRDDDPLPPLPPTPARARVTCPACLFPVAVVRRGEYRRHNMFGDWSESLCPASERDDLSLTEAAEAGRVTLHRVDLPPLTPPQARRLHEIREAGVTRVEFSSGRYWQSLAGLQSAGLVRLEAQTDRTVAYHRRPVLYAVAIGAAAVGLPHAGTDDDRPAAEPLTAYPAPRVSRRRR